MTNAEILKFLVDRFADRCEMYVFYCPDKSDEQSTVHVLFPYDINLCFCFTGYIDCVDIRCVFKVETIKDDLEIGDIKTLVDEFNEGHQEDIFPFKKLNYSLNKDEGGSNTYASIYLSGTISRDSLKKEVIDEYVNAILHPSPYIKKLIRFTTQIM